MVSSKVNKKTGSALKTRDYDFNLRYTVTHNTVIKMTPKTETETTRRERRV